MCGNNHNIKGVCTMKRIRIVLQLFVVLCALNSIVSAQKIVLQNGLGEYNGCQDTWILQYAKEGLVMQEYMPDRFDVYSDTCLA